MRTKVVGGIAAAVIIAVGAGALVGGAVLGVDAGPSENQALVERDSSWLGYLPVPIGDVEPVVTTISEADSTTRARRVDLLLEPSQDSVSLCFSATEQDAQQACGDGTTLLGRTDRDVDLPWVSLVGDTDVDLLAHLRAPSPAPDGVPSLKG